MAGRGCDARLQETFPPCDAIKELRFITNLAQAPLVLNEEFGVLVRAEIVEWTKLIRDMNL